MIYTIETRIKNFEFWGGAVQVAKEINEHEHGDYMWECIEDYFDDCFESCGSIPTETDVNDFVWFEALDYLRDMCNFDIE